MKINMYHRLTTKLTILTILSLNICCVLTICLCTLVLSVLHGLFHLILAPVLCCRYCYCSHFVDEQSGAGNQA